MANLTAEEKLEIIQLVEERVKTIQVTREDFSELKGVVAELAQAQARTEQGVRELNQRMAELTQAQARTEQRVGELDQRMAELAQAQARTEQRVGELDQRMAELTQAQVGTEQRVGELNQRMAELAQAQARTEQRVGELTKEMGEVRKELGGLSNTVGYTLEDRAYKALPALMKKEMDVVLKKRPVRKFVELPDGTLREVNINIYGEGKKHGKGVFIIGEAKAQMSRKDVDVLLRLIDKLSPILKGDVIPLGVTYSALPDVERYARDKGVRLYYSYEF